MANIFMKNSTITRLDDLWVKDLNNACQDSAIRSMDTRKKLSLPPTDFLWIDKGWLAVCETPNHLSHYKYFFDKGIRHVVSFEKNPPLSVMSSVEMPKLNKISLRIAKEPNVRQINRFIEIVEQANNKNEAVVVHSSSNSVCVGILLACYLVKTKRKLPEESLQLLSNLKPNCVNTPKQKELIHYFYLTCFRPFKLR